jgi:hypothetical protein
VSRATLHWRQLNTPPIRPRTRNRRTRTLRVELHGNVDQDPQGNFTGNLQSTHRHQHPRKVAMS